ncbi:ANTAR domain-containing protein [Paenibacillus pasadenensis]|uniref:ANTAR domain-containing response regulator n=1 Tax=Paenibacillus pasadenensis TaxID=217090 RepID=UPI00203AAD86|nr:ANTAR domain-containing protein [Paenibacillus pasadenensis]MCM3748642.1 ANTAR domain-containing protein [Paenibacillus pasadenensis]
MRSIVVITPRNQEVSRLQDTPDKAGASPESLLRGCGYAVLRAVTEEQAATVLPEADAAVLHMALPQVRSWRDAVAEQRQLPLLWWCSPEAMGGSAEACEDDVRLDGLITPGMSAAEVHWALQLAGKSCMERRQWEGERKRLLQRLEERKWIEMAKGILSESRGLSEAEAYELLRSEAMQERKRMVDVATSIVKVYELLQHNTKKGAGRI